MNAPTGTSSTIETDDVPNPPPPPAKAERQGPGFATARTWALRTVGLTLILAGGLHLQAASIQSTVAAPPPGFVQPGLWIDGSVSMVVLAFALSIISWLTFRDLWRALVPILTILASLGAGTFVLLTLMVEPGSLGGSGFRGLLGVVGFGLTALAGILLLLGHRGRLHKVRRWSIVGIGAAVVLGTAAVTFSTELWLPNVINPRNVIAIEATTPAPAVKTPRLEGTLEWNEPSSDRAAAWVPTAGGLVATTGRGVTMTDSRTGAERWAQIRYDSKNVDTPRVSTDGTKIAIAGRRDESSNVLFNNPPTRWLWVFDAITGEKLVDRQAPDEKSALRGVMAGDWLLWSAAPSRNARGTMTATRLDGTVIWKRDLPGNCLIRDAQNASASRVLAVLSCRSEDGGRGYATPSEVLLFDARNGNASWRWISPTTAPLTVGTLRAGAEQLMVMQARDGRADITLAALRMRDGRQLWLDSSHTGPDPDWASTSVAYRRILNTSGKHAVVAESTADGRAIELRAINPANGFTVWTKRLETTAYERSTVRWTDIVLPDGRLLFAWTGSPEGTGGEAARDYRLRLTTVDPRDGTIGTDTTIPVANDATVPADLVGTPRLRLHGSNQGIMVELLKGTVPFLGASIN